MAKFQRKNAWNQQGTFDNPDLLWYAKGVKEMQSRQLNDQNSWWFFAAIHGEEIEESTFPGWGEIPPPPNVPTSPVPPRSVQDTFWNQCQHQSWYFPPWHRGYLIALEDQIRSVVISLGGPADWALPYWNYLGSGNQYKMPPAFAEKTLPDGSANPLYVTARYGPDGDGNIFIKIPPISGACQSNTIYTGSNRATPKPGYGGPATRFSHSGNVSGNLESNPHNMVHMQVGGTPNGEDYGIMAYPETAALDPIFYLHHCNIDRMWAAWNAAGNQNPTETNWLEGPAASGEREFVMPMANGNSWVFTPADVNSLSQLDYVYDDLTLAKELDFDQALTARLTKFGVEPARVSKEMHMDTGGKSELIGANQEPLELESSGIKTNVKFDRSAFNVMRNTFMKASELNVPDEIYLQIENVKGAMDANMLTVTVNDRLAGHVALFGLRNASKKDGHHGGEGLTFIFNITNIFDDLHLTNTLDIDSIDVKIFPENAIPGTQKIVVGRVSIYREQQNI
ncbi:tyrosinase family protein [Ascidiimonas aurantiaca]|uniref:tyrosinase family protein n=1 Tax=Ascidiimonas aurantiaca TaxID=1685432 RepID=UPI0030EB3035